MTASMARGRLAETLGLVRFSHTIFALPFAFLGMLLAARGLPDPHIVAWIVVAMIGARTAAMTFNRLADRSLDAANPRTARRALPARRLTPAYAWMVFAAGTALLFLAAWRLNRLALSLAPLAMVIICGYSLTKRFTAWSHLFLGLSLSGAPLGAWIAVRAGIDLEPFLLAGAVLLWTAGFDIIYALQDVDFDRRTGLHSLPARLGGGRALVLARLFHLAAVFLFALTGWVAQLGTLYFLGVGLAAALLVYENLLVGPADLSRVQVAFFRVNAAVSLILLIFTSLDLVLA